MKKLAFSLLALAICFVSQAQLKVQTDGSILKTTTIAGHANLVIDNTGYYGQIALHPTGNNSVDLGKAGYALHQVTAYDLVELSDKRQKENIKDLNNALNLILGLKGVKYDIKKEFACIDESNDENKAKTDVDRKNKIGFLAQDVQKVIPEVVNYSEEDDVYTISYSRIIPILVEAIKEQQSMIEDLKSKEKSNQKSADVSVMNKSTANQLYQNAPNPFTESTTIKYEIAEDMQSAMLNLYNLNGNQLKSISIYQGGNGSVTLNGSELGAGMYMYALIVDGEIIDTKRMVLTE